MPDRQKIPEYNLYGYLCPRSI
jgi:hypothetical protein